MIRDTAKYLELTADLEIQNGQDTMFLKGNSGLLAFYVPSWKFLFRINTLKLGISNIFKMNKVLRKADIHLSLFINKSKTVTLGKSGLPKVHLLGLLKSF